MKGSGDAREGVAAVPDGRPEGVTGQEAKRGGHERNEMMPWTWREGSISSHVKSLVFDFLSL